MRTSHLDGSVSLGSLEPEMCESPELPDRKPTVVYPWEQLFFFPHDRYEVQGAETFIDFCFSEFRVYNSNDNKNERAITQ